MLVPQGDNGLCKQKIALAKADNIIYYNQGTEYGSRR